MKENTFSRKYFLFFKFFFIIIIFFTLQYCIGFAIYYLNKSIYLNVGKSSCWTP